MKRLLVVVLFLLNINCFGQKINYRIELSYNTPYIAEVKNNIPSGQYNIGYTSIITNTGIKETYDSKSGVKFSGRLSYQISSKLHLESGLSLSIIRFKQSQIVNSNFDNILIDNIIIGDIYTSDSLWGPITDNEFIETNKNLGKTSVLYTEIPIIVGYSFFNNKLICKLGMSASFLTYSEVYKYNTDYFYNSNPVIVDSSSDGLNNLLLNGHLEIEYLVYKNIGLNMNYQRSFNSIYDDNMSVGDPKYNLFSLGVSYSFLR